MKRTLLSAIAVGLLVVLLLPAAQAAPKGYAGLFKDNSVAVFDTSRNTVISRIPIPPGPEGVLATPSGNKVYVASSGATTVSVIDTSSDKVVGTIEVGKDPQGMAITPDGRRLLVCIGDADRVVSIDTRTDRVTGSVPVMKPHSVAITPDGRTAYVGSQQPSSPALVIVNVQRMRQTGKVPIKNVPRALRFHRDGIRLYYTVAASEAVQILNVKTKRITQAQLGFSPHAIAFTPDGAAAPIVVQGPGDLDIVSTKNNAVLARVPVGKLPHWVAVTPDGRHAYVTNERSNDVSVVDLRARRVTTTFPIGNAPRKIAILPMRASAHDAAVSISNFAFTPKTVTVKAGQAMTWTNKDSIPHTVTADDNKWDSGTLDPGKSYTHVFSQPGKYAYHCEIHTYMHGTVTVHQ